MFINFSLKPLRWALQLGFIFSFAGFIYAIFIIIEKIQNPMMPLGWPTLAVAITLFSGIQLLVLGMIGEFLGRMYLLTTGTPQYVLAKYAVGKNSA